VKELADALSHYVNRQVVDMTGLEGRFDFSLSWVSNEFAPLPKGPDLLKGQNLPLDLVVVDSALREPIGN
jgi:uncharacterized protein (TIGR03435 family)